MTVYRSKATDQAVAQARQVLEAHGLDPANGRCPECAERCPCAPANHAANLLADMGALASPPADDPPLLTYGWRLKLGFARRPTERRPADGRPAIEGEWR